MKRLRFIDEDGKTYYPKDMSPEEQEQTYLDHLANGSAFEANGKKLTPIYGEDH